MSVRASELGENRLESGNISQARLTNPCAGLGRGELVQFSFDHHLDLCER